MLVREAKTKWVKRGEIEGFVTGAGAVAAAVRRVVGDDPREHFCVIHLDNRNGVIGVEVVSVGTINEALCSPREVFRLAIIRCATAIVIAHQHPSGDPTPSANDLSATERLVACGALLGIEVLDHVVVGEHRFTSIRDYRPTLFGGHP